MAMLCSDTSKVNFILSDNSMLIPLYFKDDFKSVKNTSFRLNKNIISFLHGCKGFAAFIWEIQSNSLILRNVLPELVNYPDMLTYWTDLDVGDIITSDSITNLIGIGIINADRRRDMLYIYGADKFVDFITSELIPAVEKGYHVQTRIIYGHSFAGAFTIYAMLKRPASFDNYIASSPTPIMKLVNHDKYLQLDSVSPKKIVFNHSYGSNDKGQVRKWSKKLHDNLAGIKFNHIEYRFALFEGRNHNNSDIPALLQGLEDLK